MKRTMWILVVIAACCSVGPLGAGPTGHEFKSQRECLAFVKTADDYAKRHGTPTYNLACKYKLALTS